MREETFMLRHFKIALAGGLALALAAGAVFAQEKSKEALFCEAIGLVGIEQQRCTDQLEGARDPVRRDAVMVTWVKRSPIGTKAALYTPPVDGNLLNGRPGTPYANKRLHLPNDVVADIRKAVDSAGLEWK
jgi:hypothetical protein